MSRCFPFPPPGYARKCSSNEALILPIKLQREREKATSDREREKAKSSDKKKHRRREKKEKREKEKGKDYPAIDSEKQKLIEKLYDADKSKVQPKGERTLQEDECELQEKSGVTEEHGRPFSSQNVSYSSDSTGNNRERRRLSTPASGMQSLAGNIIRIRLSSRKNDDEPSTSGRNEEHGISQSLLKREVPHSTSYIQACSNLAKKDLSTQQPLDSIIKPPRDISRSTSTSEQVLSKGEQVPPLPDKKKKTEREKLSSHEKKTRKRESEYNNLFENWVPPLLQGGLFVKTEDDYEDWLFGEKGEEKPAKRFKGGDDDLESNGDKIVCSTTAVLQPRSILLPDVGIFARPYTLAF